MMGGGAVYKGRAEPKRHGGAGGKYEDEEE